ncbi:MAG: hypothetical protein U9N57_01095 [Pseudomonadota bacterium]|nr:hypothetical protein [Pseudomonadota bacterium]
MSQLKLEAHKRRLTGTYSGRLVVERHSIASRKDAPALQNQIIAQIDRCEYKLESFKVVTQTD